MSNIEKEFEETVQQIADITGQTVADIKEIIENSEHIDDILEKAAELFTDG